MRFPSITAVVKQLEAIQSHWPNEIDVRLQVYENGEWMVREGDPSFDLDHHGYWGASSVGPEDSPDTILDIAACLLDQVEDQEAIRVTDTL